VVDAWTKQVLDNGPRNYRAVYTLVFGATDPVTSYVAADPTSAGDMGVNIQGQVLYPDTHLKLWELKYDMSASQGLQILWDATTDQTAWAANGQGSGGHSWKKQGGLSPYNLGTVITGATGKILFTTLGTPEVGDLISIEMWLKKDIHQ
jgi:hypothetical protein